MLTFDSCLYTRAASRNLSVSVCAEAAGLAADAAEADATSLNPLRALFKKLGRGLGAVPALTEWQMVLESCCSEPWRSIDPASKPQEQCLLLKWFQEPFKLSALGDLKLAIASLHFAVVILCESCNIKHSSPRHGEATADMKGRRRLGNAPHQLTAGPCLLAAAKQMLAPQKTMRKQDAHRADN